MLPFMLNSHGAGAPSAANAADRGNRGWGGLLCLALLVAVPSAARAVDSEHLLHLFEGWPVAAREHALEIASHPELIGAIQRHEIQGLQGHARLAAEYFAQNPDKLDQLAAQSELTARVGDYHRHHPAAARSAVRNLEQDPDRVRAILGSSDKKDFFGETVRRDPALAREQARLLKQHPEWRNDAWNSARRTRHVLDCEADYPQYAKALRRFADENPRRLESRWRRDAQKRGTRMPAEQRLNGSAEPRKRHTPLRPRRAARARGQKRRN